MSKGEFISVAQANGGIENMINWEGKDQDTLALIKYIADEDKLEKILENPQDAESIQYPKEERRKCPFSVVMVQEKIRKSNRRVQNINSNAVCGVYGAVWDSFS